MSLMGGLSRYEDSLVEGFHAHPFFRRYSSQSDDGLKAYLVQKSFLSKNFVPWYLTAMGSLKGPEAKQLLREIVSDEMPAGKPTHWEDLLADLEYIGVPREAVQCAKPSSETLKAKERLNRLVRYSGSPDYDLRALSTLRMAGEILVAEEYRHVVPELEKRFGLTPEKSRFYYPHFKHDEKGAEYEGGLAHTDSFEEVLGSMITDESKLAIAKESAKNAFKARLSFYDQFTARHKIVKAAKRAGTAAAAAVLAYIGASHIPQGSMSPAARERQVQADIMMARLYEATGKQEYLLKIGTSEAIEEAQLEGP